MLHPESYRMHRWVSVEHDAFLSRLRNYQLHTCSKGESVTARVKMKVGCRRNKIGVKPSGNLAWHFAATGIVNAAPPTVWLRAPFHPLPVIPCIANRLPLCQEAQHLLANAQLLPTPCGTSLPQWQSTSSTDNALDSALHIPRPSAATFLVKASYPP